MRTMEDRMIADLPWLAPIGALVLTAIVAVALALVLPRGRQGLVAAWVAGGHVTAAGLAAGVWLDRGFRSVLEGTLVVDALSLVFIGILGVAGAVTVAVARPSIGGTDREGEFYAMLAASTVAAAVLGSAADAALLAISLGLSSLTTFVMTGYLRGSARGNEASLKYYVYGTVAGAVMVYGLSWWFGIAGSTDLRKIGEALANAPDGVAIASTTMVLAGLAYKASLVPLHFWAPDAYDGAPLPVAAYLSVLSKLAGLVALARVLPLALPEGLLGWPTAVAIVAAATMTLGNLAMIPQRNVVRLLAYSSIAQSGYLLMAVAALHGSGQGRPALLFYAMAYAAANLAAFAVVQAVQRERRSVDISAFAGLGRAHPWWTLALILAFLSLLGLPPLAGFVGKLELFRAAIDAGQSWLAVVAIVNTVISLYPYLRVVAPAVLDPDTARGTPWATGRPLTLAAGLTVALTVAIGIGAEPLLRLAEQAAG
ncbi:MAG: NADH-quinone oxidoreductase subunit N [Solirubrobacteraceae bacterium]